MSDPTPTPDTEAPDDDLVVQLVAAILRERAAAAKTWGDYLNDARAVLAAARSVAGTAAPAALDDAAQRVATACGRGDLASLPTGDRDYFRNVALAALAGAGSGTAALTDPMIERAAEQLYGGPHHRFKLVDGEAVEFTVTWSEIVEKVGQEERDGYLRQARRILSAALGAGDGDE